MAFEGWGKLLKCNAFASVCFKYQNVIIYMTENSLFWLFLGKIEKYRVRKKVYAFCRLWNKKYVADIQN